jgi:hypothetical protein
MLLFYLFERSLSLSLFHPRWFLDGLTVVQSWKMSSSIDIIDDDLGSAAIDTYREESISLMPEKMPSKLGITSKNAR